MKNKNQQKLVLGLVLVLLVVIFALLNTDPASINFGITSIKVPLILLIVFLILIGAGVAFLMGNDGHDKSSKKVEEQLKDQEKELQAKFNKTLEQKDQQIQDLEKQLAEKTKLLEAPTEPTDKSE